ncbi:MAG: hypothetical protein QOF54_2106, partial [Solirubrobacteraceae bacterium]|nr:hypothetical protein [Solirubrobacteraceae bacterium]
MDLGPLRLLQGIARALGASRTRRTVGIGAFALACALVLALIPALDAAGSPAAGEELVQQGPKLTATTAEAPGGQGEAPTGQLGMSAALSGDGSTLIVGASKDAAGGAAYVFSRVGSGWVQQARLTPGEVSAGEGETTCTAGSCPGEECTDEAAPAEEANECAFGSSVAVSADGDTAVIGDPSPTSAPGSAWVFTRASDGGWTRSAVLIGGEAPSEARFGRSVALAADGATALIGDPSETNGRGGAWLFSREGSGWARTTVLIDSERSPLAHFGRSVALSGDGTTALVAGPGDAEYAGAVWVFSAAGGAWAQRPGKLTAPGAAAADHFGRGLALSRDGSTALIGAPGAEGRQGAVWAFVRSGADFAQQGPKLLAGEGAGEARFGASVALSGDATDALIGAPYAEQSIGTVTQLHGSPANWTRAPEGLAGSEAAGRGWLGTAVALSDDGAVAAITAPRDHMRAGAAWVFASAPVPPPAVTNVRPGQGPAAGGTEVVISGANFNHATQVQFGATAVKAVAQSTTEIVTVTPPGAPGKVHVTVTTPAGTSATSSKDTFVYEGASVVAPAVAGTTSGAASAASSGVQGFISTSGAACRVSLAKKRLAVTRYRSVALRLLRSGTGVCSGRVALSYKVAARGHGYSLRTIGTASFSIPTATSRVV